MGYAILENTDKEFTLAPVTFGRYEKMREAQLHCTAVPENAKAEIRKEFNIPEEDDEGAENYGIAEMYRRFIRILFIDAPKAFELKDVNIAELNRAVADFFASASGS